MHKSEQELKADLVKASVQLSESGLALAQKAVRLSIFEATGEVMVGYETESGLSVVRKLSSIDQPLHLRESEEVLFKKLEGAQEFTPTDTLFRHYKSESMVYLLSRLAIFDETGEVMVGYDAQYGDNIPFERQFSSFTDYVRTDNGLVERFQEI